MLHAVSSHGIFWIVLGGLFYNASFVFYACDRKSCPGDLEWSGHCLVVGTGRLLWQDRRPKSVAFD